MLNLAAAWDLPTALAVKGSTTK